jgi:dodecin
MSSVARVTEISAESETGFEDAIRVGIERAASTLRGIRSAWVKEQSVQVSDDRVSSYRVDMLVTFLLED